MPAVIMLDLALFTSHASEGALVAVFGVAYFLDG